MTRETRIGLLIGLGFVIMFGLVLSELTSPETPAAPASASGQTATPYPHTYVIDESRSASGQRTVVISRSRTRAQDRQIEARVASGARGSRAPAGHAAQARRQGARAPRRYAVQPGDTLIGIARKVYGPGNEGQYRRIFQANSRVLANEGTVRPGQVLSIPALTSNVSEPARAGVAARPGVDAQITPAPRPIAAAITHGRPERIYVVKRADTLPEIAYAFYADDSRRSVMRIYNANKEKLEGLDHLPMGMALTIPR